MRLNVPVKCKRMQVYFVTNGALIIVNIFNQTLLHFLFRNFFTIHCMAALKISMGLFRVLSTRFSMEKYFETEFASFI